MDYPKLIIRAGTWYLVDTNISKESAHGYWERYGELRFIQSDPMISGWRATWDHIRAREDRLERTGWLMEVYTTNELRARKMLCKFLQSGEQRTQNEHPDDDVNKEPELAPVIPVAQNEPDPEPEPVIPMAEDDPDNHIFWGGDFLELNDLEDHLSLSPTSTLTSEYSDPQGGFDWESRMNDLASEGSTSSSDEGDY